MTIGARAEPDEEIRGFARLLVRSSIRADGGALSIADVAIGVQLAQLEMVAGLPDVRRWPRAVTYAERLIARPSFAPNLAICRKIVKQRVDLNA